MLQNIPANLKGYTYGLWLRFDLYHAKSFTCTECLLSTVGMLYHPTIWRCCSICRLISILSGALDSSGSRTVQDWFNHQKLIQILSMCTGMHPPHAHLQSSLLLLQKEGDQLHWLEAMLCMHSSQWAWSQLLCTLWLPVLLIQGTADAWGAKDQVSLQWQTSDHLSMCSYELFSVVD